MLAKKVHLRSPPQNVTNKDQKPENHNQGVILRVAGLNEAYRPTHGLNEAADKPDEAVHNPAVPPAGPQRTFSSCPGRAIHDPINDFAVKSPERFAGTFQAVHKEGVVKLVDVPF